jgi:DNA-binding transcriptional regulator YhcF (GntR family)
VFFLEKIMNRYTSIPLNRDSKEHLYIQLANGIEQMIVEGELSEKDKLPPIRKLADLLDVNTVTVVNAYKYLEQKGRVFKKIGSGTFVVPFNTDVDFDDEAACHDSVGYDFSSTSPTGNLFPVQAFKKAINGVLDTEGGTAFSYQESKGYLKLREAITEYLHAYDVVTTAEDVQIISGAQQGIDIVTKSILEYGDYILVESPTYAGAIATFRSKGLNIIEIPIRRNGINFENLESIAKRFKPKLFYTMPNFQNPTGNIKGANIEISGHIVGDVASSGLLKIYETGVLDGDIEVMSFIIEEGGAFRGNCDINTKGLGERPVKEQNDQDDTTESENKNPSNRRNRRNQQNNDNEKSA